ncbi:anti sigma factor C-terminal domain-containing protein [Bacillus licheniformis]|nr:anti sigma factor C-terminal domain-containing protein [Bacillus licheniformis]
MTASKKISVQSRVDLKQLPDGTVTEAFLSFERAYPTKELYDQLKAMTFAFCGMRSRQRAI